MERRTRVSVGLAAAVIGWLATVALFRGMLDSLAGRSFTLAVAFAVPAVLVLLIAFLGLRGGRASLLAGMGAVVALMYGAALTWDAGRPREHAAWLFGVVVLPFFLVLFAAAALLAWLVSLLVRRLTP